jgi:hypothetical protein
MPKISEFHGIAIYMYYQDHEPPHFHAIHCSRQAIIGLRPIRILSGSLSRRALTRVRESARQHRRELQRNWALARSGKPLSAIAPLE